MPKEVSQLFLALPGPGGRWRRQAPNKGVCAPARTREDIMSVAVLCRIVCVLLACTAAGCAGRAQSLSPVRELPREAIPNDPVPGERYYLLVFGSERAVR